MNIVFISIQLPDMAYNAGGFYPDLIKELATKHKITVLAPALDDGFHGLRTEGNCRVLRVPSKQFIGDISIWKKGIRLITLSKRYIKDYEKFLGTEKFDVVFMSTPPMNFVDVFRFIKNRSGAKGYLILRDIHPECLNRKAISQKAIDNNLVVDEARRPYSVNPLISKYLSRKASKLYHTADIIGCMSPGNCEYIKKIHPAVDDNSLKVLPNWYSGQAKDFEHEAIESTKRKYDLENKFVAIFGGTIGEAQAIWNILALAQHNMSKNDVVFLVVGRGSKKNLLQQLAKEKNITNIRVIDYLPRTDYENILASADVGLISIDEKYNVPTCPSKIIGYMALSKPVLAIFNKGNDYGKYYIDQPKCGFWCDDLNYEKYFADFDKLYHDANLKDKLGNNGFQFFRNNLTVKAAVETIESHLYE